MTAELETVAFLIETWHLIYSAKKMTGFYMKPGVKWVITLLKRISLISKSNVFRVVARIHTNIKDGRVCNNN